MRLEKHIRQLAKSGYWQTIYNSSKTCSGVNLFINTSNFSGLQVLFLYWLRIYNMLYNELTQLSWDNLDEQVIKDDDRCDAFLYWRSKQIEKDIRKMKKDNRKSASKKKTLGMPIYSGKKNKEGE